jgi:glycosyltransferase involved in cell wall biosynthesis
MASLPAISVVIPSYNRPALTDRAVRSVLAQTWTDLEIVVVDDASKPDQVYSPESAHDPRVRLVRHAVNQRVSAARNTGVQESRGRLVAFLDSDDYWLPHKLASQMSVFEQQPDPEKILVYSTYYWEQNGSWLALPARPLRTGQSIGEYYFLEYGDIHTSTWLAARNLYARFPFTSELTQSEDWDLLLQLEQAGVRFVHCPTPAGVRNCDSREDRLSTIALHSQHGRFIERNARRLTPMAYEVALSLVADLDQPNASLGQKLKNHLRRFLTSPRLGFVSRLRLCLYYVLARLTYRMRVRSRRQPARAFPLV